MRTRRGPGRACSRESWSSLMRGAQLRRAQCRCLLDRLLKVTGWQFPCAVSCPAAHGPSSGHPNRLLACRCPGPAIGVKLVCARAPEFSGRHEISALPFPPAFLVDAGAVHITPPCRELQDGPRRDPDSSSDPEGCRGARESKGPCINQDRVPLNAAPSSSGITTCPARAVIGPKKDRPVAARFRGAASRPDGNTHYINVPESGAAYSATYPNILRYAESRRQNCGPAASCSLLPSLSFLPFPPPNFSSTPDSPYALSQVTHVYGG